MSDTKLLPCPFCGGAATLNHGATDDWDVSCRNLRCFGPETSAYGLREDAIAAWNRRATSPEAATRKDAEAAAPNSIKDIVRDAVVETASRPSRLRGPYVFDEDELQEAAKVMNPDTATAELVERLKKLNPWQDMDWPEVVAAAIAALSKEPSDA